MGLNYQNNFKFLVDKKSLPNNSSGGDYIDGFMTGILKTFGLHNALSAREDTRAGRSK